jgi:hypothetical protein
MARTSAGISETLPHSLDAIADQVRRERAVSARSLGLGKLGRGAHAELLSALGRVGLEHTGKTVRVPLREQIRESLARAGSQGLRQPALAREVKGARNATELRLALEELLEQGSVVKLVDESGVQLATSSARALNGAELDQLAALAKRLAVLAKATRPTATAARCTLARSTLEAPRALLQQLAGVRESGATPAPSAREARPEAAPAGQGATVRTAEPRGKPEPVADAVLQAVLAAFLAAPAPSGLIRVPDLIRALERLYPRATLVAAADALARRGELELRPEASIARLPREERARCPLAPDGTPLSYARLLAPGRARP